MLARLPLIVLAAGLGCQSLFSPAHARQPNLILIMADDLGYETIGANGGESYQTPHLDQLAATGMRFERCHVQPLCTPTRVQLMTGMYNVRNYSDFGEIDRNATTFAHLLKNAGYATAVVGKWQLGQGKKLPQRLGFDESCLWQHTRRPARYANPGLEYNGEERDFENGEYGPTLVNDYALDFVARNKDQPFFLYYPMILTHSPYVPTPDSPHWDPKARGDKGGKKNVEHFGEMVAYMDKMVGRLVAKLDELGIRDNTLVIFLGDNGTGKGVTSRFKGQPYHGGKGQTDARGTHVPLIANWRGQVPAGRVNGDLIDSTDFLPTLCTAAGAEVPQSLTMDGRSFLPQLRGEAGKPRDWIYSWYAPRSDQKRKAEFAMTAALKVYRGGNIFDLTTDPFEERPIRTEDLNDEQAKEAQMLTSAMDQFRDARPAHLVTSSGEGAKKKRAGRRLERRKRNVRQRAAEGAEI